MPETLNWQHIVAEGLVILLPMLASQWLTHRASKKDADKREQQREFIEKEYPHHGHGEKEGPLSAEGIRYPKANGR